VCVCMLQLSCVCVYVTVDVCVCMLKLMCVCVCYSCRVCVYVAVVVCVCVLSCRCRVFVCMLQLSDMLLYTNRMATQSLLFHVNGIVPVAGMMVSANLPNAVCRISM